MTPKPEAEVRELQRRRLDVWSTLPDTPRKPFGSALKAEQRNEIITPALITITPARITRLELRAAIDGESK